MGFARGHILFGSNNHGRVMRTQFDPAWIVAG
jgi:hypothetical protein